MEPLKLLEIQLWHGALKSDLWQLGGGRVVVFLINIRISNAILALHRVPSAGLSWAEQAFYNDIIHLDSQTWDQPRAEHSN